jgi:putative alpha-1,2-mannosidase
MQFGDLKNKTLQVKVGLSLTSTEAASKNLGAENRAGILTGHARKPKQPGMIFFH